jgi:hypothetical protein
VTIAASLCEWLAKHNIQVLSHHRYSPNIADADFVPRLWIRIGSGFSDFVDPDPYWESGSKGKKMKQISVHFLINF